MKTYEILDDTNIMIGEGQLKKLAKEQLVEKQSCNLNYSRIGLNGLGL